MARPEKKFIGDLKSWDLATDALVEAVEKAGLDYQFDEGGGAFLRP